MTLAVLGYAGYASSTFFLKETIDESYILHDRRSIEKCSPEISSTGPLIFPCFVTGENNTVFLSQGGGDHCNVVPMGSLRVLKGIQPLHTVLASRWEQNRRGVLPIVGLYCKTAFLSPAWWSTVCESLL